MPSMLDGLQLRALLPAGGLADEVHFYESIGSTNDRAKELAEAGAPEGTLVVADEQTAGRGRGGRTWFTPPGAGLAFSVVLRSQHHPSEMQSVWTALGALATREGLLELGAAAEIKWPNDVLVDGRKVAGVLAEAAWRDEALAYVVIGIGVNVHPGSVPGPKTLDYPAECVDTVVGRRVDRAELLAGILGALNRWHRSFRLGEILTAWEAALAFRGEEVHVEGEGRAWRGRLSGLGPRGELRLRLENGDSLLLQGAMHLRPVDSGPV
ncbi:MAG TPA: biotin--[acetyl-CoA-carboxylase] ligase [Anaerolineales bacterium]|nr:biotin--[acetyl-CoA-carboxylase] ligase [Anaerolineales bacterium]